MDGAHLMSSYSICSFILIAWRLASGLIYSTLLRLDSKDRIIHFLLDCSAVLTLSEHITNFNESLQYSRKSKVHWPPFIGRDLQHFHLSLVLTFISITFSSLLSRETFFYKMFSTFNLVDVVAENFKKQYNLRLQSQTENSGAFDRAISSLYRATALSLDGKRVAGATSVTEAVTFKKVPWAALPWASPQLCTAPPAEELVSVFMVSSLITDLLTKSKPYKIHLF